MSFHPYTYRGLDASYGYGYGDADGQSYIGGDYYGDYGHQTRDPYDPEDNLLLGDEFGRPGLLRDERWHDHDGWTCPDLHACTDFIEYPTPVYDAWGDESWEEEQVGAEKRTFSPLSSLRRLTRRDMQYALADLMVRLSFRPHDPYQPSLLSAKALSSDSITSNNSRWTKR